MVTVVGVPLTAAGMTAGVVNATEKVVSFVGPEFQIVVPLSEAFISFKDLSLPVW